MKTRRRFLQTASIAALPVSRPRTAKAAADFAPTLFELRSYRCKPGQRDALIAMFEEAFLDAYQAGGTRVVATFRHLDQADRWVWIRAFRSAAERGAALKAFYGSAAWKARADPANATIRDIDPALLLRAAGTAAVATLGMAPARGAVLPESRYLVEIHPLAEGSASRIQALFERDAAPLQATLGAAPPIAFVTDRSENSFPRQPVRTETTLVTLTRFAGADELAAFESARAASAAWREYAAALGKHLAAPPEMHRLQPTARSALR